MGQFLNSVQQVAKNYSKYDVWEQKQADSRAQKEALAKQKPISQNELEVLKTRSQAVIRATEIMDARSEDNCENMEQFTATLAMIPAMGISMAQSPTQELINKKTSDKYNTKISELTTKIKNSADENFKQETKKEIDALHNKLQLAKKRNSKLVMIGSAVAMMLSAIFMILWGTSKQKEASRIGRFQAKQNELKGLESFVEYTPEQIAQAQEIANSIPDEKEKKNFGKIISELCNVKRDKAAYKNWLAQKDANEFEKLKQVELSPESLQNAKKDKEMIVNVIKDINIKAEEYSENLENAYDTFNVLSFLIAAPLGFAINALLNTCKVKPKTNAIISAITPFLVTLGIGISGTYAQKKAARVGRYKARKDLTENPMQLYAFSDNDMESVKDVKANKQKVGFFKKIGQNFKFIKTYQKDRKEYNEYRKTTQKKNEKLQKAFKEIDLSEQQKKDAKSLQTNVFRAFDEVDEMSQRYSEDVEAGCEIAKETVGTVISLGTIAVGLLAIVSFFKGKLPIIKWGNKLVNWTFDKNSSIKKAMNNLQEVLSKKDKKMVQELQYAIAHRDMNLYLKNPKNAEIAKAIEPLIAEVGQLSKNTISESIMSNSNVGETGQRLISEHLKKSAPARWLRGLIGDILKIVTRFSATKEGKPISSEVKEALGLNFSYKNYKTLINTSLIGGVPIMGALFGVPYAFNAWLTNIQKKAGKIGVMQAVNNLDDPKLFAPTQD